MLPRRRTLARLLLPYGWMAVGSKMVKRDAGLFWHRRHNRGSQTGSRARFSPSPPAERGRTRAAGVGSLYWAACRPIGWGVRSASAYAWLRSASCLHRLRRAHPPGTRQGCGWGAGPETLAKAAAPWAGPCGIRLRMRAASCGLKSQGCFFCFLPSCLRNTCGLSGGAIAPGRSTPTSWSTERVRSCSCGLPEARLPGRRGAAAAAARARAPGLHLRRPRNGTQSARPATLRASRERGRPLGRRAHWCPGTPGQTPVDPR